MRIPLVMIAALSAASCASTQTVLSKEPNEVFFSENSQNEVAFCLATKNASTPLDRDDGSKVVLVKNGYDAVSLAFTIWPEGEGSRIEYRKSFGTVGPRWRQCF